MDRVTWAPPKDRENRRKHSVAFDEASTVFDSPLAVRRIDAVHSVGEQRLRTLGWSVGGRLLVVTSVDVGSTIRLISARRATKRERHDYEAG